MLDKLSVQTKCTLLLQFESPHKCSVSLHHLRLKTEVVLIPTHLHDLHFHCDDVFCVVTGIRVSVSCEFSERFLASSWAGVEVSASAWTWARYHAAHGETWKVWRSATGMNKFVSPKMPPKAISYIQFVFDLWPVYCIYQIGFSSGSFVCCCCRPLWFKGILLCCGSCHGVYGYVQTTWFFSARILIIDRNF